MMSYPPSLTAQKCYGCIYIVSNGACLPCPRRKTYPSQGPRLPDDAMYMYKSHCCGFAQTTPYRLRCSQLSIRR